MNHPEGIVERIDLNQNEFIRYAASRAGRPCHEGQSYSYASLSPSPWVNAVFALDLDGLEAAKEIARLIASGTLGRYTEEQILESLETDSNRMRSGFFEYFVRAAALRDFLDAGTFVLRSAGPDGAVVAITLGQERRDFGIVREHGVFKFDFFSDLLR